MGGDEQAAAGWYADPWAQAPLRWWDGATWTGFTEATQPHAPATDVAGSQVALDDKAGVVEGADGFVALDFETATRHRASACAVSAVLSVRGAVQDTRTWIIQPPDNAYAPWNTRIHGMDSSVTSGAPPFSEVMGQLVEFIDGRTVVAHNGAFDYGVIRSEHLRSGQPWPTMTLACSLVLARRAWPGETSYSLPIVCSRVGVARFRHHDPTEDARACAELVHAILATTGTDTIEAAADELGVTLGRMSPATYDSCLAAYAAGTRWVLEPVDPSTIDPDHPFANIGVAFTGTLSSMPRKDAANLVTQAGGKFHSSMSKLCSFLVMGEQDFGRFVDGVQSEKTRRAAALIADGIPIQIIGEDDFLKMVAS